MHGIVIGTGHVFQGRLPFLNTCSEQPCVGRGHCAVIGLLMPPLRSCFVYDCGTYARDAQMKVSLTWQASTTWRCQQTSKLVLLPCHLKHAAVQQYAALTMRRIHSGKHCSVAMCLIDKVTSQLAIGALQSHPHTQQF